MFIRPLEGQGEAMSEIQLDIRNLHKTYDPGLFENKREVLRGVDLEVRRGEIFGFLGPNGAGKTTTIKAITGLITPDRGTVSICGHPHTSLEAKRRLGFMPESPYFYKHLTGREFLGFYGQLLGLDRGTMRRRVGEVLELVAMTASGDRPMRTYSKGMLQRLALGQALLGEPALLILDEPMSGLDPLGRRLVRDVILTQRESGTTVFFSSHILPDVEMICDRVAVLADGRVAATGAVMDIVARQAPNFEVTFTGLEPEAITTPVEGASRAGEVTWVRVDAAHRDQLIEELGGSGARLVSLTPLRSTLEEFLLSLNDGRTT